jgi:predicted short-subunit dehydrogenase-like oxidoreductase (DUF2520 family)
MKTKKRIVTGTLRIGLIGAGALGTAMAYRLHQKGFDVTSIISRNEATVRRLGLKINCARTGKNFKLLDTCNFIIIAVPDAQVKSVAKTIKQIPFQNSNVILVHTSGSLNAVSMKRRNQNSRSKLFSASMHPMQSFPAKMKWSKRALENHFRNIYFGIEGDAAAIPIVKQLVKNIGARSLIIPNKKKELYHMGGVVTSNFMVALAHIAMKIYEKIGLNEKTTLQLLRPIMFQTLENLQQLGIADSLTGPVVRNDLSTISNHSRILKQLNPDFQNVYKDLTAICFRITKHKNQK